MQIFKINKQYQIVCQYVSTRSWFRHTAELILNGYRTVDTAKCCYINRTWERFTYESVIQKILSQNEDIIPKMDSETLYKICNS